MVESTMFGPGAQVDSTDNSSETILPETQTGLEYVTQEELDKAAEARGELIEALG